jgi:biopolymer transport protein ExbB
MKLPSFARPLVFVLAAGCWLSSLTIDPPTAQAQDAPAIADVHAEAPPAEGKSKLMWFLESSGWIGAIILLLSMYFIATVGRLFFELRREIAIPPDLVAKAEAMVGQRDFQGVYNLLKDDESEFGQVALAGITELGNGLPEAREAMEHAGEFVTVDMERKISMLAVLGTLGPMIGLLGTLKGMIASFSVIALSDTQLKASEVAGGISEALLLTFEGVALSVPAIYFYAVFRNRVMAISVATVAAADEFVRRMAHAARRPATPTAKHAPVG